MNEKVRARQHKTQHPTVYFPIFGRVKNRLLLCLCGLWTLCLSAQVLEKNPDYIRGNEALAAGLIADARLSYFSALQHFPESSKLWYNLGTAYFREENYKEALNAFRRVRSLDFRFPRVHHNLGLCFIKQLELDSARACMELENSLQPEQFETMYFMGALASVRGEDDTALYWLNTCIQQVPDFAPALHDKGIIIHRRGDIPSAGILLEEALRLQPENPVFLVSYAGHLRAKYHGEKAYQLLSRYEDKFSANAGYQQALGALALERGNPEHALICFERARESGENGPEIILNMAAAQIVLGNDLEALRLHGEINKLKPDWGPAALNAGIALENLFQQDHACEQWRLAQKQGIQKAARYLKERCEDLPAGSAY